MSKLLVLKGLPASGKSTYAKELVAKGWKRVNKDEIRLSIIGDKQWSREKEKLVRQEEFHQVEEHLFGGFDVVVDSTNFAYEKFWEKEAETHKAEFEIKFFDVPVMECVDRDAKRGKESVGAKVIFRMYNQYLKPELIESNDLLPDCYIFDIDGTLALMDGRSPYDYTKVNTDKPNRDVVSMFKLLYDVQLERNFNLFVVSGREKSCEKETAEWLVSNDIIPKDIYMRETGDHRDDRIVKKEIYDKFIKGKYNVIGVFDDRDRVVEMWRSLGLTCFQVAYGKF